MSRTIDELCQRSYYRRRTSHVAPARSHHIGVSSLCTTLFAPSLAPCPDPAPGCDAYSRSPHSDCRLAGDGVGGGAPFHQLPSRLEPGYLVSAPGQSDTLGPAHHTAGPFGSRACARGGRHGGAPLGTEDRGPRVLSRCGALHQDVGHPRLRAAVGRDAVVGARALEPACVGVAVSHRAVLARRAERPAPAQDEYRLGAADVATSPPVVAGPPVGVGRCRRLCRGIAGAGLCQAAGRHGLAPALGCRAGLTRQARSPRAHAAPNR
jgi:hypothetical protein